MYSSHYRGWSVESDRFGPRCLVLRCARGNKFTKLVPHSSGTGRSY